MRIHADDGPHEIDVTGIGRQEWRELFDAHPPRPEDDAPWNDETFPPALISACANMSLRLARKAWHQWPEDAAESLFHECLRLSAPKDFSWAAEVLRRNPRRAAEVRASMEMRIPLSEFLSWPTDDQDMVLAAMERDAMRCSGCGMPDEDTKRPGQWFYETRVCEVCKLRHLGHEDIPASERAFTHLEIVPVKKRGTQ